MATKKDAKNKLLQSDKRQSKLIRNFDVANTSRALAIEKARQYIIDKYDFRYNLISNEIEIKSKDEKVYRKFDDWDFNTIMIDLDFKGVHLPDNKFKQLLESVYVCTKYDPIKEWIFSIEKWDGKIDHIQNFFNQVYLTNEENREYYLKGFKKWFVAYVMSFLRDEPEPFNVNQICLVLLSRKQGRYKSTWLGSLIPAHLRLKYYYPNSFNVHNKDHIKYLATKMLINLDEMESYNKTEIGSMKSVITYAQVSLRLPYGRLDINAKRRASFCGSINNRQFLRDESGSRRWFVIEVDGLNYDPNYDVSGMYAQAVELLREGFQYWFDGNEITELEKRNSEFTELSMEEEELLRLFNKPEPGDELNEISVLTTSQIANIIAKDNERMNINNSVKATLGRALAKHEFERVSVRLESTKHPVWAWKVKPSLLGLMKMESSANGQKDLF